jgi:hypothetical protein
MTWLYCVFVQSVFVFVGQTLTPGKWVHIAVDWSWYPYFNGHIVAVYIDGITGREACVSL